MATATAWNPGRELRIARQDSKITQEHVAIALGVSRPLVSKWERNKAEPTISQWRQMIHLFDDCGVSTQDLRSFAWSMTTTAAAA